MLPPAIFGARCFGLSSILLLRHCKTVIRYVLPVVLITSCLQLCMGVAKRAYAQRESTGGSSGPGAESAVYDCLVVHCGVYTALLYI